jgi:hypothetical protein
MPVDLAGARQGHQAAVGRSLDAARAARAAQATLGLIAAERAVRDGEGSDADVSEVRDAAAPADAARARGAASAAEGLIVRERGMANG